MKSCYLVTGNHREGYHKIDSGVYQLVIGLERTTIIVVGALGAHDFPHGTYIYTGRAARGLNKRVERHIRPEKRLRWHIDYLLEHARIDAIAVYPGNGTAECSINRETARTLGGTFPLKGFGSSDCRCTSHLMLVPMTHTRGMKAWPRDTDALSSVKDFRGKRRFEKHPFPRTPIP